MEYYRIRVSGHLDKRWSEELGGLEITCHEDGTTLLEGAVMDQGALFGILLRIRDLNLQLLSTRLVTGAADIPTEESGYTTLEGQA